MVDKGFPFSMDGRVDNKNKKPYLYVTYLRKNLQSAAQEGIRRARQGKHMTSDIQCTAAQREEGIYDEMDGCTVKAFTCAVHRKTQIKLMIYTLQTMSLHHNVKKGRATNCIFAG